MVDAVYAALDRVGAGNVDVVVSETSCPSAGGFTATVENARIYNTSPPSSPPPAPSSSSFFCPETNGHADSSSSAIEY
ncbi:hypothetical protein Taro_026874 [Colocasia esculenta]|uniref:Uncharacterized protein n=1 Tax=Colocasia esculenta TaxID=4460 RepID=A0A843VCI7_COLES|nr:hypothetical protein [Colocasia esculenta]